MAAVSISAYIDERDAMRVRMIAETEHCSVANFIANAVAVFSDLPKGLRDSLLELRVDEAPWRSSASHGSYQPLSLGPGSIWRVSVWRTKSLFLNSPMTQTIWNCWIMLPVSAGA